MENAQLFKRLFDMSMDQIGLFINDDESITNALYKLDTAARTRLIIRAIQIEDLWQAIDEETNTFDLYLSMRLSPMTLSACFDLNHDLNTLEWQFVFPTYKEIADDVKPKNFGEYLALNKNVRIMDIENYDIDMACEFLDRAYDFTPHMIQQVARTAAAKQGGFRP